MKSILDSGLPIDMILNLILVVEGIRPAVLIEDKKKHEKIIKKYYPDLYYSELNNNVLLSKNHYKKSDILTNETLGVILGYPCACEFEETLKDIDKYGIDVLVEFNDNNTYKSVSQLFGNMAINLDKLETFNEFAKLAEDVLKNNIIVGHLINRVYIEHTYYFSKQNIINMVITNKIYDEKLKECVQHELENIGFPEELCSYNFEFTNKFHKGILLSLITYLKNDPLEKFYPYESDNITSWGDDLLTILNN